MRNVVTKIIASSEPNGNIEAVWQLTQEARNGGADAIVLLGSLVAKGADPRDCSEVLKAAGDSNLPVFYVPGENDVPYEDFLREATKFEVVFSNLRCVHGTFAMAGPVLFSGMGGKIEDDPKANRSETESLSYSGWEMEFRLKFINELKDYQKVFLFTTPPEHKGLKEQGSVVVAEMIKTYAPRLAVIGGHQQKHEMLGNSHVVVPGVLTDGNFTMVDMRTHEVTPGTLRSSRAA
jgi:uncharacterized protein